MKETASELRAPEHIAIIMDGNGRWAKQRGLPRIAGHRAGAESVRKTVESCINLGVKYLTLYAFSSENWNRPESEINALMQLLERFLKEKTKDVKGIKFLASKLTGIDSKGAKNIAYNLEKELNPAFILLGIEHEGKAQLVLRISDELANQGKLHAGNIIRDLAKHIRGGGGGQSFFATAGGADPTGIEMALAEAEEYVISE